MYLQTGLVYQLMVCLVLLFLAEEGTFTCQIPTCSPLALMIDAHWNMPYQNWELTPVEDNGCVLTITGPHVQVKVNIKVCLVHRCVDWVCLLDVSAGCVCWVCGLGVSGT